MYPFPLQFHPPNARMFIPMVLVVMPTQLEARTAFLDPCRALATVCRHQTLDVPDAIAFRNDTRLGKHVRCQLTHGTGAFGHGVSVPVRRCFSKLLLCLRFFSLSILHGHANSSHLDIMTSNGGRPYAEVP